MPAGCAQPIRVDGVKWASVSIAARHYHIPPKYLRDKIAAAEGVFEWKGHVIEPLPRETAPHRNDYDEPPYEEPLRKVCPKIDAIFTTSYRSRPGRLMRRVEVVG